MNHTNDMPMFRLVWVYTGGVVVGPEVGGEQAPRLLAISTRHQAALLSSSSTNQRSVLDMVTRDGHAVFCDASFCFYLRVN